MTVSTVATANGDDYHGEVDDGTGVGLSDMMGGPDARHEQEMHCLLEMEAADMRARLGEAIMHRGEAYLDRAYEHLAQAYDMQVSLLGQEDAASMLTFGLLGVCKETRRVVAFRIMQEEERVQLLRQKEEMERLAEIGEEAEEEAKSTTSSRQATSNRRDKMDAAKNSTKSGGIGDREVGGIGDRESKSREEKEKQVVSPVSPVSPQEESDSQSQRVLLPPLVTGDGILASSTSSSTSSSSSASNMHMHSDESKATSSIEEAVVTVDTMQSNVMPHADRFADFLVVPPSMDEHFQQQCLSDDLLRGAATGQYTKALAVHSIMHAGLMRQYHRRLRFSSSAAMRTESFWTGDKHALELRGIILEADAKAASKGHTTGSGVVKGRKLTWAEREKERLRLKELEKEREKEQRDAAAAANHSYDGPLDREIAADMTVAGSYSTLGLVMEDLEQLDRAEDMFRKSLAVQKAVLGDIPHIATARDALSLGQILHRQGKHKDALPYLDHALNIMQLLRAGDLEKAVVQNGMALCLFCLGQSDEARDLIYQVCRIYTIQSVYRVYRVYRVYSI